ncbi:MAG: CPBP family intramembrane metalloprotease [Planctomycetota bacterium]|nr:CPBP family intramembrane metalloprotease [Planctomycetota bacterium]
MAKDDPNRQPPSLEVGRLSYWELSKRPLQILTFLLPLIILYEIGLALLLRSESGIMTNKAHESLLRFFDAFGINLGGGLFLGGLAIVVVLLIWHLLTREAWKIDLNTAALMALESIVLILPLLVIGQMIRQVTEMTMMADVSGHWLLLTPQTGPGTNELAHLGLWSGVAISVGAGLYEELLFRMMFIAAVHTLLVDVCKVSNRTGMAIALVLSSIAFALYHPLRDASGQFVMQKLVFYFLAGLYFGAIYLARGFGIVVAVHAFYDILTITVMNDQTG